MWLDRFSNHSTPGGSPPPHNRSSSAAPKRPSQIGQAAPLKPGFSPRTSSLNVAKFNTSTASLNSPRIPNGSGLRQEIVAAPDVSDPLDVLETIVGHGLQAHKSVNGVSGDINHTRPEVLVDDIDFKGLGLHEFLRSEGTEGADEEASEHYAAQTAEECEYVLPSRVW